MKCLSVSHYLAQVVAACTNRVSAALSSFIQLSSLRIVPKTLLESADDYQPQTHLRHYLEHALHTVGLPLGLRRLEVDLQNFDSYGISYCLANLRAGAVLGWNRLDQLMYHLKSSRPYFDAVSFAFQRGTASRVAKLRSALSRLLPLSMKHSACAFSYSIGWSMFVMFTVNSG